MCPRARLVDRRRWHPWRAPRARADRGGGCRARPSPRARSAPRATGQVSPVRRGDWARLPALLGGAPPRRGPNVPAPLRRAARAARRAPRHLPAAIDRPVRRSLRRGDGAPRPAHGVDTRRSARDRAHRGWRPAGRDHRRRPRRSPCGTCGGIRRPAVVAGMGRRASQRWCPDPPRVRARVPDRGRAGICAAGRARRRALGVPARALAGRASTRLGHSARPPRCADSRVRRRFAVDGSARLAGVREARWGPRAPRSDRARAPHGVGARRGRP